MICGNSKCKKEFQPVHRQNYYCSKKCLRMAKADRRGQRGLSRWPSTLERRFKGWNKKKLRVKELVYKDKLAKGCSACGEKRPNCLQYHHLDPSSKRQSISKISSMKLLLEEMSKCILLCANCHTVVEVGDGYKESDRPPVPPTSERFLEITNRVYEEEYDEFYGRLSTGSQGNNKGLGVEKINRRVVPQADKFFLAGTVWGDPLTKTHYAPVKAGDSRAPRRKIL